MPTFAEPHLAEGFADLVPWSETGHADQERVARQGRDLGGGDDGCSVDALAQAPGMDFDDLGRGLAVGKQGPSQGPARRAIPPEQIPIPLPQRSVGEMSGFARGETLERVLGAARAR